MLISAIAAMSENRVIGKGNQLPWHIPRDMKWFRKTTLGHPIIMGRKTFESVNKVLPGRENIIVSRQMDYQVPGGFVVSTLENALELCKGKADEVFIVGGAELYRLALPQLDRLYLTQIHQIIEGDAFFPEFSWDDFKLVSREDYKEEYSFSFFILERILKK
jgi:dihydrofolate reductase